MRTFSNYACGDSKVVERSMTHLAQALRRRFDLSAVKPRDVLSSLGIEKFLQPVLLRGYVELPQGAQVMAHPYLGLPPDWADEFRLVQPPSYVLVIENLASFNRHAREVLDGGALVFSGGFPSRATLTAIRRLDATLPVDVPFFHWDDTDPHGFLIHRHIAAALGRRLETHMMEDADGAELEKYDPRAPIFIEAVGEGGVRSG